MVLRLTFSLLAWLVFPFSVPAQKYWPAIYYLSPSWGPVHILVTIEGQHFGDPQANSTVTFNGTQAQPTSWSDTHIVVWVPDGATTGVVRITVNGSTKSQGDYPTFTVVPDAVLIQKIQRGDAEATAMAGQSGDQRFVPYFVQRIQAGDAKAIAIAGRSGDQRFVPYLKKELETDKTRGDRFAGSWQSTLALARLGQTDQLQEIWCRAITDDPKHGLWPSTYQLELVGGWFAIQGIEKLLTPEGLIRWHKPSKEERNSDALSMPFNWTALEALPKVVPSPHENYPTGIELFMVQTHSQEHIRIWQNWIAAHQDELSKLQPAGEGVDFSPNACKNGKPVKKH